MIVFVISLLLSGIRLFIILTLPLFYFFKVTLLFPILILKRNVTYRSWRVLCNLKPGYVKVYYSPWCHLISLHANFSILLDDKLLCVDSSIKALQ